MNRTWTTLIGAAELRALLADGATPVIVDCSFDLMDTEAGERAWREGHLPGSHYLHLDRDLSGPKSGRNGRHPLPERSVFSATLGRLGVTPATQVIVLDRQGGTYAARLWWMLRWLGHEAVAVLDGGLQAWTAAGGDVDSSEPPPRAAAPYPDRQPLAAVTSADALAAQLGRVKLVDARAGERFRGEVEPLDKAAGHIPGALNRFFKDLYKRALQAGRHAARRVPRAAWRRCRGPHSAPVRLGRDRLPQPAGHGACRPGGLAPVPGLVERVVVRPRAARRARLTPIKLALTLRIDTAFIQAPRGVAIRRRSTCSSASSSRATVPTSPARPSTRPSPWPSPWAHSSTRSA
jgi:thiosulfate/3-mercaptopyruvate sulfurtransferase